MSDKIEVCGKMCVVGNVYIIVVGGRVTYAELGSFGFFHDPLGGRFFEVNEALSISPINGEVLEDAP